MISDNVKLSNIKKKHESFYKSKIVKILNEDKETLVYLNTPSSYSYTGISDITGVYRGRFIALEIKRARSVCYATSNILASEISAPQLVFLMDIAKRGGLAYVLIVDDTNGACLIHINNILDNKRITKMETIKHGVFFSHIRDIKLNALVAQSDRA